MSNLLYIITGDGVANVRNDRFRMKLINDL